MLSPAYVRHFESILRHLAARGHAIDLVFHEPSELSDSDELGRRLAAEYRAITLHRAPDGRGEPWPALGREVRACLDYIRFLDPRYNALYGYRTASRVPVIVRRICGAPPLRSAMARTALEAGLRVVERAIPSSASIDAFIRSLEPDIAVFTPLIGLRTAQPDYLKSARALGIKTVFAVASWDNLSSKSVVRPIPDLVTVWNEAQRDEAVSLHGIPRARVTVTGAPPFDQWFDWRPRPRADFCRRIGIRADRSYVLYVCSALFKGGPSERELFERWLRHVRSSALPALRDVEILVRPHPKRAAEWKGVSLSGFTMWPKDAVSPTDTESKADYYDSIYHSAAVVGLNTSALVEAGIVGRPVHTVLMDEAKHSQDQTLHFRYLTETGGGLLNVARSLDEHVRQLAASVSSGTDSEERNRRFVTAFVRPRGLEVSAAAAFVEVIEMLAGDAGRALRHGVPVGLRPLSALLYPAGLMVASAHRRRNARRKSEALSVYGKLSRSLREGRDFGRSCYAGARRLAALRTFLARRRSARRCAASADFHIPSDTGYRLFAAGRFAEAEEVVKSARELSDGLGGQLPFGRSGKTFMVPLLDQRSLTRESSYVRFALRPDVVAAVANYLGVVPVLGHIDVYYSSAVDKRMISSKLFHCDGDDTSQIKVFILCSDVGPDNGPTVVMDASTSRLVRRKVRYAYRGRVTDDAVHLAVGPREFESIVGPPGTVCFVDTSRCFHYGSRVEDDAVPRLVTIIQFLSPFSFMLPHDHRRGAPYRHLATSACTELDRAVLGAI